MTTAAPTSRPDWATEHTLADIAKWLSDKRSVVVTTHSKPDGDAAGSATAIARALNIAAGGGASGFSGIASRAEIWFHGPLPAWTTHIVGQTKWRHIDPADPNKQIPAETEPDAVLIVDTGSRTQLEPLADFLAKRHDTIAIVDHHRSGSEDLAERRFADITAAAAAESVAELCRIILGCPTPAELPPEIAEPLYMGLASDTGWFRHGNTTPAALRLAADLMEAGAPAERIMEMAEQRERPARLKLLARALATLELHEEDRIGLISLKSSDFDKAGAAPGESGGFVDQVRTIESVRVAALLTEMKDKDGYFTKISLRSKGASAAGNMIDVNEVCKALGGGGHAQAAGARVRAGLDETKTRLLTALRQHIDN